LVLLLVLLACLRYFCMFVAVVAGFGGLDSNFFFVTSFPSFLVETSLPSFHLICHISIFQVLKTPRLGSDFEDDFDENDSNKARGGAEWGGGGGGNLVVAGETSFVETLSFGGQGQGGEGGEAATRGGGSKNANSDGGFLGGLGAALFGNSPSSSSSSSTSSALSSSVSADNSNLSLPKLVVTVEGSWDLKRRTDLLMSTMQDESVVLDVTAQVLKYGPVEVSKRFIC
jgi:hypothetical protein